jgi:hypothetical protein
VGVILLAEQHNVGAVGPADEASYPAVDRFDPGGAPGIDRGVIEPDGRAVERQRRLALAGLSATRNDPDALYRTTAQYPAEMQLAGHRGGLPAGVRPGPFETPGADETPKEHELIGVLGRRAGDVERLYQPSTSLRPIRLAGHWLCSSQRA